jgi:hypothetical protein
MLDQNVDDAHQTNNLRKISPIRNGMQDERANFIAQKFNEFFMLHLSDSENGRMLLIHLFSDEIIHCAYLAEKKIMISEYGLD